MLCLTLLVLLMIIFILCLADLIAELDDNGGIYALRRFSSSLLCLQRMHNICKAFCTSVGLTFNANKTVYCVSLGCHFFIV